MPPKQPPPAPRNGLEVERARAIAKHGWFAMSVFPTADRPCDPFTYTMGLWRSYDHPELIIVGLDGNVCHAVFAGLAERIKAGEHFEGGQEYPDLLAGAAREYPAAFRQVAQGHRDSMMMGAARWNAFEDFPALQLVWPDPRGVFPWESDYDRTHIQPLLTLDQENENDG